VLAFNAKGGLIDPFGGHDLPPLECYFLGGENSIRGHKRRSIYLRDSEGNPRYDANRAILGGDSFVHFNLEYHFLLGGPFRLLLFTDAGNVFGEGHRGRPALPNLFQPARGTLQPRRKPCSSAKSALATSGALLQCQSAE
jgi:outer membrane protein assembly factor BamA